MGSAACKESSLINSFSGQFYREADKRFVIYKGYLIPDLDCLSVEVVCGGGFAGNFLILVVYRMQ
jgi:hypothetical protein